MKLLGWMHQRLRQVSREQSVILTGDPSSCKSADTITDEHLFLAKPTFTVAHSSHGELFHGLLAIGTLGSELLNMEQSMPTLPTSFQNLTKEEIYITENDVKLINNDLEQFLAVQAKKVTDESSERTSQESIIDFSNEQLDNVNPKDGGYSANCPLQRYRLGNSIELPVGQKEEKIETEDLFSMSGQCSENSAKHESPKKLQKQSYAMRFMKSVLKKVKSAPISCRTASSATDEKATISGAVKVKLPKVLKPKFFHRKVHPVESIAQKQLVTVNKDEITVMTDKSSTVCAEDGEKKRSPKKHRVKKRTFTPVPYSEQIKGHGATANRERWIKTDDYLVLEL